MKTKQIAVIGAIAVRGIAILVSATSYWSEFLVMQENRIKPMEYNTAIGSPVLGSASASVGKASSLNVKTFSGSTGFFGLSFIFVRVHNFWQNLYVHQYIY